MNVNIELQAFSSEDAVKEIAQEIIHMSDVIHRVLRGLSPNIITDENFTSYALLTEEYALRSRANILLIDAKRFVFMDSGISQDELIKSLSKIEEKFNSVTCLKDLSMLIVALMLFANSIVSKHKRIISFMFAELNSVNNSSNI
jgi:hypothetical protein